MCVGEVVLGDFDVVLVMVVVVKGFVLIECEEMLGVNYV